MQSPSPSPSSARRGLKPAFESCGCGYVAVYGTLRARGVNDIRRMADGLRIAGVTCLTGTLHDLGWYPGLVLQGTRPVVAEVYPLNPALEQALDRIEGLWPHDLGEYIKRVRNQPVTLTDGAVQSLEVLVYEATPRVVHGAPVIDAGDWLAWFRETGRSHPGPFQLNTTQHDRLGAR